MRLARGFTLIEMLMVMTMLLVVSATAAALMAPAQAAFQAQPERADLQQRLRVAVDALQSDLRMAGAGVTIARFARGPLTRIVAPVRPYRAGDDRSDPAAGVFYRADTISVLYVPATAAQAQIRSVSLSSPTVVDAAPNCGPAAAPDRLCGFQQGMRVLLVHPSGVSDRAIVADVVGTTIVLQDGLASPSVYRDGFAAIAEAATHTYYLKTDLSRGTSQLMHYDGRTTDLPIVDDVVALRFEYFGDPGPPQLLPGADVRTPVGPWTTYGARPPPVGVDDTADAWPAGENCAFAVVDDAHVPRGVAMTAPAGSSVRLDAALFTDGPWCPDGNAPDRFDLDLLRIRRVHVMLRLQVGPPALRGPAGALFMHGGTARSSSAWVPDEQIEIDVAPRNLNADR